MEDRRPLIIDPPPEYTARQMTSPIEANVPGRPPLPYDVYPIQSTPAQQSRHPNLTASSHSARNDQRYYGSIPVWDESQNRFSAPPIRGNRNDDLVLLGVRRDDYEAAIERANCNRVRKQIATSLACLMLISIPIVILVLVLVNLGDDGDD